MRSEIYDLIPGGGPALAGIHDRRSLFKGAKEPDPPPPVPAPVRADMETEGDAARAARRKKGIQSTILANEQQQATLGAQSPLGVTGMPNYSNGGQP